MKHIIMLIGLVATLAPLATHAQQCRPFANSWICFDHRIRRPDPALGPLYRPISREVSCSTDSDCVAITGVCGACWMTVNTRNQYIIQDEIKKQQLMTTCPAMAPPKPHVRCVDYRCVPCYNTPY